MLRLALRNTLRQKVRSAMTLAAIAFGVSGLILSGGFVRDIYVQLGEALIHSQSGHLQIFKLGFYSQGARSPEKFLIERPNDSRGAITSFPEVKDVLARLSFSGLISNGRRDWPIVGEGVEPEAEMKLGTHLHLTSGRALDAQDTNGIMVGSGVAEAMKLVPGDRVILLVTTPKGALNTVELELVGVFQTLSKDFDARAVRIPLPTAKMLLDTDDISALVISLHNTDDTADVAARLRPMAESSGLEVKTWIELNDFYEKTVALYERQFGVLQAIILAMVMLSTANSVNMTVFERLGEFGTSMALGSRARRVRELILTESFVLGLVGAAIGVFVGITLAVIISAIGIPMPPPPNASVGYTATIRVVPSIVGMSFAIGVVATAVASVLPARRVSNTPVVEALRLNV